MKIHIQTIFKFFAPMVITLLFFGIPQRSGAVVVLNCGDSTTLFGSSCSLSELVAGGSFTINDKQFSNWDLGLVGGQVFNTELIRVDLIDNLGRPGFTLFDTGTAFRLEDGASSSTELSFEIDILDGPFSIVVNDLSVNFGDISGNSSASVFEDAADGNGNVLSSISATCDNPGCANSVIGIESTTFAPQNSLLVVKDINLFSGVGGVAEIQSISQLFQQEAAVPEPNSLLIVMLGFFSTFLGFNKLVFMLRNSIYSS